MKRMRPLIAACLLCLALPGIAQDPKAGPAMDAGMQAMMAAWEKASTPGAPHRQLEAHFAGTWTTRMSMWMDPAQPPMTDSGQSHNTLDLGGRQLRMHYRGRVMDMPFEGLGMTGYDNVRGRYVSHWTDNMSTGHFVAEGDYDPASRSYTFRGEMPDPMAPGRMTPIREVIRITDADHHVLEMYETHDGTERKTMQIEYSRVK